MAKHHDRRIARIEAMNDGKLPTFKERETAAQNSMRAAKGKARA
jgi:hypothetical protein